jgi:hypothetical protein
MSITIRANVAANIDYAAIRADGYQAEISAEQCHAVAEIVEAAGLTAYAYEGEEERFYGSYVPAFGLVTLPEAAQAEILRQFADNFEALRIIRKAIEHRIQITFTRDCGDNQYRVRLVSERADAVDLNLTGGGWTEFAKAILLDGALRRDTAVDFDAGHVDVADVLQALDNSASALMFSGEWHQSVAAKLREVCEHTKAIGGTELVWS